MTLLPPPLTLHRAIVGITAAAILAGLIPAGAVLSRRLASALEERTLTDLSFAPRVLAARRSAVGDAMMMHAKEFAHEPALAAALLRADRAALMRSVELARQSYTEGVPVVVAADGQTISGPTPDSILLEETRRGRMPVGLSYSGSRLNSIALAPVTAGTRWLGAAGFASPLDDRAAAMLAGLTRSNVILMSRGTIAASTLDTAQTARLMEALRATVIDSTAHEVVVGRARFVAIGAELGAGGQAWFLRALDEELSVLPALRRVALLSALGALLVALVLGAMFATRVSRPAGQLATAATELARGSFSAPLPESRVVELRQLADAFDSMRRALAARLEELRLANAALVDRNARLTALQSDLMQRDRLEASGRLVAQLAHEIRNPVANLRNCLEIIRRRVADDAQARDFADLAIDELLRMHELAEQMLDLQRPRDPASQVCTPVAVAREVARLTTAGIADDVIRVQVEGDASARAGIAGDALKQVLLNLVQNAREAAGSNRGVRIRVQVGTSEDEVHIDVHDDGPGVVDQIRTRIFDPFFTTKESVHGVGLGLFVGEGLVRTAGGRIALEPNGQGAPSGAHFRIDLPAPRDDVSAARPGAAG